jgi:hypothetical protein
MTQMLLFDASSPSPAATVAAPVAPRPIPRPAAMPSGIPSDIPSGRQTRQEITNMPTPAARSAAESSDGVQHMGDLARLVLLRYQLVAKRRAEMEARKAN